jgi:hypothetical protein
VIVSHGIAHTGFARAFASGDYTPRDIAIGDHADWFQVLHAFDYSNLAAIVLEHHLGCFLHRVFRRAARNIGDHNLLHGFAVSNRDLF